MKGYKHRKVVLIGQLAGTIWQGIEARKDVDENISERAKRFVNADGSGLVDAVKSVVDADGDFQFAKLTADSFVVITHTYSVAGRERSFKRFVDVANLPSLTDFVDLNAHTLVS